MSEPLSGVSDTFRFLKETLAKSAGASRDEVIGALLMGLPAAGLC
jgi:hypothetical protein